MAGKQTKQDIISFKVDKSLGQALAKIPNRSEFIRGAIRSALVGSCPLCRGTGTLTLDQRRHWEAFLAGHTLVECGDCHALHLVCEAGERQ